MNSRALSAAIIGVAMVCSVYLYRHLSPYQSCVRALTEISIELAEIKAQEPPHWSTDDSLFREIPPEDYGQNPPSPKPSPEVDRLNKRKQLLSEVEDNIDFCSRFN